MQYDAVIVASGKGTRANLGYNKVLYVLENDKSVLENACHLFIEDKDCQKIILVTNDEVDFACDKMIIVEGGEKRSDSVINGLKEVESEYVLIHDGARPFLEKEDLENVKKDTKKYDAALLVCKSTDTIKYSESEFVEKTINRNYIYRAQTPQGFKTELIKKAYEYVEKEGCLYTDDASVVEEYGHKVKMTIGSPNNIKLTYKEDFK